MNKKSNVEQLLDDATSINVLLYNDKVQKLAAIVRVQAEALEEIKEGKVTEIGGIGRAVTYERDMEVNEFRACAETALDRAEQIAGGEKERT